MIYQNPQSLKTSGARHKTESLCLGARDFAILWDVYVANPITAEQISALHFEPTAVNAVSAIKNCQRRLRQYVQAGYVQRQRYRTPGKAGRYQYLYTLTEQGAATVYAYLGVEPGLAEGKPKHDPKGLGIAPHNLIATAVRIAVKRACAADLRTELDLWLYDRELRIEGMTDVVYSPKATGKPKLIPLIPDAVFVLRQQQRTCLCFVEIDTGSTTVEANALEKRSWVTKTMGYANFLQSEQYRQRYSRYFAHLPAASIPPARVLVVTTSERRLQNLVETTQRTLVALGAEQFCSWLWFTTTAWATDAQRVLAAPIWYTAAFGDPLPLLPQASGAFP
ncbi:MAG: replication-relaxation family protein [Caldilineaceae bacterium]